MANITWSGIESSKYGLTADWYVSAYYGSDTDDDSAGDYDASTNTTGHGGPTRPFATIEAAYQKKASNFEVTVVDSGYCDLSSAVSYMTIVGDGNVILSNATSLMSNCRFKNIKILSAYSLSQSVYEDCEVYYSALSILGGNGDEDIKNTIFIECTMVGSRDPFYNCAFISCSGIIYQAYSSYTASTYNNLYYKCESLTFTTQATRPSGYFVDYSIIIGSVETNISINGKTTGVTVEDFKTDGNYFVKSYSEVDLFSNTEGSSATVTQMNTVFCNYFSPIYLDTWPELNLYLLSTASDLFKYGGLNGTYIGAFPVMYWFTASTLWDTYRDTTNTSGLEIDSVTSGMIISDTYTEGTFRSLRIDLTEAITADVAKFCANLVYNIEGTVKQGVANQRIDTTTDLDPDNTANQRIVYDFKMAVAADSGDTLGSWQNYELDREPTVDADGYSHLDDLYDSTTETQQTIQSFMIEFTLREIVID